ncbi:MAG TPA: gamma-glutamyltransferase [Caulobacteraceae bacterium]|jgi:gamma-glutamyltranspeptidase/glutathione hydrolase
MDDLAPQSVRVDLSASLWPADDYARAKHDQVATRTTAMASRGNHGGVAVSYNAFAARAGLEALKQGGSAADAALTTALTQVTLSAGGPISFFGILSLVYFEAKTGKVHTMNAEWNTITGEDDPLTIPGGIGMSEADIRGKDPSGRTALVGGFMKGVEAAHKRFGKLPFASLFDPSIELAEKGFKVGAKLGKSFGFRPDDLKRLPETRETLLKADGTPYAEGDVFCQPRLAETLRAVAETGADHMYGGPWGERLVKAVRADGGKMTLEDLERYQVIWDEPLVADLGDGYSICTNPWPNGGGVPLIEAQNLARVAGLDKAEHWSKSADSLRLAVELSHIGLLLAYGSAGVAAVYPDIDFSPQSRVTRKYAEVLWAEMKAGKKPFQFTPQEPRHSDDVVAVDAEGNIAAITHSINCVLWGKTAIVVDGISIADAASFQQPLIAATEPGGRLSAPTETGIVFKDEAPVFGFASMNAGLHQRTFQCLLNTTAFGMSLEDAVNTPDFFLPTADPATGQLKISLPQGRFPRGVVDALDCAVVESGPEALFTLGQGDWVAVGRDPKTGKIEAVSHNRVNSGSAAY